MGKLISIKLANRLALVVLALPFLVLLPSMGDFPYRSADAQFSDFAITHFPNAVFLLHALQEYHQIPLWSPTILSGYPFFANPLSGLFYPPGWLALLFHLPFGFNLVLALHLVWGGLGMFQLLKTEGLSKWAALFGGLGFAMLPKVFAHYGAGHLTLLYAIAWTPWLLYCKTISFKPGSRLGKTVIPDGIILGIIFLADVRWSFYAGILWVAYRFSHRHDIGMRNTFLHLIGQGALAFLVAAPLALPLIQYTQRSSRASMGIEQIGAYSLPVANLIGVLFPDFHGNHEWVVYAGGIGLTLAVLVILANPPRSTIKFWGLVFVVSLVFALGEALPGFAWLARIPGFDLLRAPSRAVFLAGMGLVALAGYGCETVIFPQENTIRKRANLGLIALFALTLFLGIGLVTQADQLAWNVIWGMVFSLAGVVWILVGLNRLLSRHVWLFGLFCLAILDWGGVALLSFSPRPAMIVLDEQVEVAEYLASQAGQFRVYSPSYSMPQQTAVAHDLKLADGVDPMQLLSYAEYMEQASGVPHQGYQVTIPTFSTGNPSQDNITYLPDLNALGNLNVAFIVAAYDIKMEGLNLVKMLGDTRIYRIPAFRPRAWVQPSDSPIGLELTPVVESHWNPNRIEITAQGPGLLVLSEIAYPGWQARIDGEFRTVLTLGEIFRGVMLEPGIHQVVFNFVPSSLILGIVLMMVGLVIWFVVLGRLRQS